MTTRGLLEIALIAAAMAWGIRATVITIARAWQAATISMMTAVDFAEAMATRFRIFMFIFLYRKVDTAQAYTQATTPASVGVKIPERIPPIMITGIIKAGNAFLKAVQTSRGVALGIRA